MEENSNVNVGELGTTRISDDVVCVVAGMAAAEVSGVAGMCSSIGGGIAEMLGKKSPTKGVKVEIKNQDVVIDIHIIVEFGSRIPDVAWNIQEKVKASVESMTGLAVLKVNIHIDGVNIEKEKKSDSPAADEAMVKVERNES